MKLFEMKGQLPEEAGLAELEFTNEAESPGRKKELISLPADPQSEFFSLQDGAQFLFRCTVLDNSDRYSPKKESALYFGGTDEQPFLVRAEPEAFPYFVLGGEVGFYEALKPPLIKWLEGLYGRERTNRQGDIFAYSLPSQGHLFSRTPGGWWIYMLERWEANGANINLSRCEEQLFGTRHVFRGRKAVLEVDDISAEFTLGEGVVEAPDHKPLVLRGPHLFQQAAFLFRPQEAD